MIGNDQNLNMRKHPHNRICAEHKVDMTKMGSSPSEIPALQANITNEHRRKNPQQNFSKQNSATHQKAHTL